MSRVISVLNMKGGVGKTTITINLAYRLAESMHKKVLVIDFDPQANASGGLLSFAAYEKHRLTKKVISDIFSELETLVGPVSKKNPKVYGLEEYVARARNFSGGGFIDIVPSELELSTILERAGGSSIEDRLKILLRGKKQKYDYILIDCGPTYSVLTNNSLKASNHILIPVKPDPFSARGIPLLLSKLDAHNRAHKGEDVVTVLGIVFSMVDDTLRYVEGVKAEILKEHKNVFTAEIRQNEHYARGLLENKSIYETAAHNTFKTNFSTFVDELEKRLDVQEQK